MYHAVYAGLNASEIQDEDEEFAAAPPLQDQKYVLC